ncbi:hypothetical protein FA15DRAFT_726373 [Coprinopsis marcescibilis]|uniref:Vacuolar membrane-associated protein IML1 n=1 Tax=Coprinopsis marcescibilis TaxID=230819 RepID=A0A5C3LB62_COPMA|nr:hypothetical protein FA15DRAFT_726373 [Coprinopsis marcescibilis]
MSGSRAESQHSQFSRRRSNTSQSVIRALPPPPAPPTPLNVGDSKTLNAWVHEVKDSPNIIFNHVYWPGVAPGDLVRVTVGTSDQSPGFLFQVPRDEGARYQLQISIPKPIAEGFSIRNNEEVTLTKVNQNEYGADHVEFVFQDQYLGRNDMWRLGEYITGQCVYVNQEVTFLGGIAAKIQGIYIGGKPVSSAIVTAATKAIYRSLSAKVTIFIQVCKELWEFAGDGERYYEKIVHSFLPALFNKWKEAGTNHTVAIVLISRVYYEKSEIDYAAGPLRSDERGNWYKDFYKVITDLEVNYEWKPTLINLKNSFWDFQRDILLAHHYHRASLDSKIGLPPHVRLVGQISYAQDGPILEALQLALNPMESHYIDRSLSLTGATTILITPGTGYFRVNKQLLRLTTTRMLDQGVVLNLVLLTKQPLHQSPIFSFQGVEPDCADTSNPASKDPLWSDDAGVDARKKKTFWWEPFWLSTTFWDKQMDLPFRQDRFVARAKMHEIQMLGLLEHDVLPSIEVPFLAEPPVSPFHPPGHSEMTKEEAETFDNDIFAKHSTTPEFVLPKAAVPIPGFVRSEKRNSHRNSVVGPRITTIEESPRKILKELPDETSAAVTRNGPSNTTSNLSVSPSKSSIRSTTSHKSTSSAKHANSRPSSSSGSTKGGLASKLTPSWLFNPFRSSGITQPETSQVVVAVATVIAAPTTTASTSSAIPVPTSHTPSAPIRMPLPSSMRSSSLAQAKGSPLGRSILRYEEDSLAAPRGSFTRRSPLNTPPRDDIFSNKRRSMNASTLAHSLSSTSPASYSNPSNPSQPQRPISYLQSSMAKRWEHILPFPLKKHEIKWKAMVTPACLPLTVDHFPSESELENAYDCYSYEFVVDPTDLKSFLVRPPAVKGSQADVIAAWALMVMREMAAVRLAQGYQFIIRPSGKEQESRARLRRMPSSSFVIEHPTRPQAIGAADVLKNTDKPVYLSITNEIHEISFNGEVIKVRRFSRKAPKHPIFKYQCLIWPKLGVGYTELSTSFEVRTFENWNPMDMVIGGYQNHLHESLRYWRTRFIVIPTSESPSVNTGPSGEKLNEEEVRILGIEKLAEQFTKLRWQPPGERDKSSVVPPPVRFLQTTLDPATCVLDESLVESINQVHEMGPLRINMKSEREFSELSFSQIAAAMKEDGLIKNHHWHKALYYNSFTGAEFVSWLVREFRDVNSREHGTEWGVKCFEKGLIEHCRAAHPFLDGHYYYRLKGESSGPVTPNIKGWFKRLEDTPRFVGSQQSAMSRLKVQTEKSERGDKEKRRKRLILSQTMIIDMDPNKKSDQAECVVLHHDIIHNPANVFHFELQWIGTTARCIEDMLRQWNRAIERYGLKLVEAYVMQISDIRERNAFQSCFPIPFAVPPPTVPDLDKRVLPEGTKAARYYFEYALLQKFGFVVDVEAQDLYSEQVDVFYSYRRSPFHYSQFVHRSGVAFVQVLDGGQGFLFLTNRLIGPGRMGVALKNKGTNRLASTAEELRLRLYDFCQDADAMNGFYDEQLAILAPVGGEDPPPLVL